MKNEVVKVNNKDVSVKEFRGQRVVTFKDIDLVHERPEGTAGRNFRENRKYFIEGEDYIEITPEKFQSDEIRRVGIYSPKGGIILTESGYLMLVKSFTDELAWQVQRQLVKSYFKKDKKEKSEKSKSLPLPSVNTMVKNVAKYLEKAGVDDLYIAAEIKRLYTDAGYPVNAPLITDKETMPKLYDCTEIAKELGIYSTSGKPHSQAVGAIIKKLHIEDSEIVTTAFSRNGHDDATIQYKPSVFEDVKLWLDENNYPTKIPYIDSKGNQKTCTVAYQEVA